MKRILPAGERYGLFFARYIFIILLTKTSILASANNGDDSTFNGRVRSNKTFKPIEAAKIQVKNTNFITFTNQVGLFSLPEKYADSTLVISSMGYKTIVDSSDARISNHFIVKLNYDTDNITPLKIGDAIPESFWQLPLHVVNHPENRTKITLDEMRSNKILILDFWASWCVPCIKSMDNLEIHVKQFDADLAILGVCLDFPKNAINTIENRNWNSISVVDEETSLLARYFFQEDVFGLSVWIKDNRLFAITRGDDVTSNVIQEVINGDRKGIESNVQKWIN